MALSIILAIQFFSANFRPDIDLYEKYATISTSEFTVIFLAYFISFSAFLFAFVYTFVVPTLIKSYPKYKKITHIFIRKECFKANYDKQMLEIISTISQSMNKNNK